MTTATATTASALLSDYLELKAAVISHVIHAATFGPRDPLRAVVHTAAGAFYVENFMSDADFNALEITATAVDYTNSHYGESAEFAAYAALLDSHYAAAFELVRADLPEFEKLYAEAAQSGDYSPFHGD